ncbi:MULTISPECIES: DUF29 domain-containing protein [Rhodopseudomonas]|uniref:DUF29 domain-containing protein n=1 Tax=Rhodopseudomonas palustris TaxID=1076 RepID=A0A0D7F5L7_RHOPL|nr:MULTISPECIES: DUF29 domain-containing protein [Rhodopseudomonas]KIZ48071.1 hypothetical protein OO17_00835 [Rhodopseudomonas palustris]MDF3812142.1 DUF29 domain-containing protein [Rhodopseudomonas sp. BAL398]WOK16622.1 DUF29 domain-containing protein [Rhodopseudomonas sp. BAL398]
MTTSSKIRSESTAQPAASARYADDRYGWVEQQVALLRQGRVTEIDADNIAEELSDVGGEQYDKLESAIRVVLLHLLKWDQQPTHRSKSWVFSIRTQRRQIARVLKKNPSLKPHIAEAIGEAYLDARDDAQEETGLPAKAFGSTCPYDWDAILSRAVEFEDIRSPEE